ncbi:MAG TPA: hypothetical protein PKD54_02120 [Pirellulaceae bacterium]|nr:hypothetical protein [Pirellulaceae bacterium]
MTTLTDSASRSLVLNWRRGPFAGHALTIHDRKLLLRWPAEDEADYPQLLFIQGPRGVMLRALGDDVNVNGVVADTHSLEPGDELFHPRFSAQIGFGFQHPATGESQAHANAHHDTAQPTSTSTSAESGTTPSRRPRTWRRLRRELRRMTNRQSQLDRAWQDEIHLRLNRLANCVESLTSQWIEAQPRPLDITNQPTVLDEVPADESISDCRSASATSLNEELNIAAADQATQHWPASDFEDEVVTDDVTDSCQDHGHVEPCPSETIGWTPAKAVSVPLQSTSTADREETESTDDEAPMELSSAHEEDLDTLRNNLLAWKDSMLNETQTFPGDGECQPQAATCVDLDDACNQPTCEDYDTEPEAFDDTEDVLDKATASLHQPSFVDEVGWSPQAGTRDIQSEEMTAPSPPAGAEVSHEDVSSYMAKFFSRLNIQVDSPIPANIQPGSASSTGKTIPAPSDETTPVLETENVTDRRPMTDEEFVPHCEFPERKVNLQTLRDLANQSTKSAIQTFADKKRTKTKLTNALLCSATLICSLGLMAFSQNPGDLNFLLGITGLIGSASAGFWIMAKSRILEMLSEWQLPAPQSEPTTDEETAVPTAEQTESSSVNDHQGVEETR